MSAKTSAACHPPLAAHPRPAPLLTAVPRGTTREIQRWAAWLAADEARDPRTGHWWSWRPLQASPYPYPEATAWVLLAAAELRAAGWDTPLQAVADSACATLLATARTDGGLGRSGRLYAFDSGVAAAAVAAWTGQAEVAGPLLQAARSLLADRRGVEGGPPLGRETAATHWSEAFGVHLLWLVLPLRQAGLQAEATELTAQLLTACAGEPLRHHRAAHRAYLHALAYGAEGLATSPQAADREVGRAWLRHLADRLGPDGVAAWSDGGPAHLDVTAQIAWLAARLGGTEAAEVRHKALGALHSATDGQGGVAYRPASPHRNTWCTAFALRAMAAVRGPGLVPGGCQEV